MGGTIQRCGSGRGHAINSVVWLGHHIMLPWKQRLYFWGVHGVFVEVLFSACWEYLAAGVDKRSWKLMGYSSAWSFLTYGLGTYLCGETFYRWLAAHQVPLPGRLLVYVMATYVWELSCGLLLVQCGACPWDYSAFTYNLFGVITLEYAPLWAAAGLYFEIMMGVMASVEPVPHWKLKNKRNNTLHMS